MTCISKFVSRLPGASFSAALLITLAAPLCAHAADLPLLVIPGGTYRVTNAGIPETMVAGGTPAAPTLTPPPGANFTISAGKKAGFLVVHSTNPAFEPMVEKVAYAPLPGGSYFAAGILPGTPGEQGYASLIFTGSSGDAAAAGSIFDVEIFGGPTVTYTTVAGDTFSTVYSDLLAGLQGDGINAFVTGDDLTVIDTITDPNTYAGAVEFTDNDPNLSFAAEAGTVTPEPESLVLVATGIAGLLGCLSRRRSLRG